MSSTCWNTSVKFHISREFLYSWRHIPNNKLNDSSDDKHYKAIRADLFDGICSSRMRGLLIQHEVSTWHQVEPTSSVFLRPIQWGTYFMQGLEWSGNLNVLLLARCLYIFIKFGIYAHLINLNMEKNSIKNTSPRTPSRRYHPVFPNDLSPCSRWPRSAYHPPHQREPAPFRPVPNSCGHLPRVESIAHGLPPALTRSTRCCACTWPYSYSTALNTRP